MARIYILQLMIFRDYIRIESVPPKKNEPPSGILPVGRSFK
jgi:hypothetical protein